MSDKQKKVDETEGVDPAEAPTEVETQSDTTGVAEATPEDLSRTAFVSNARAGEQCICPDGRKGTVHKFDAGFVCIPNHDQGE